MPDRIGSYEIREVLGEDEAGLVYLAEQVEPVRRLVALKLIKLGRDAGQAIARFESERAALAVLSHPNIARTLDLGSSDEGRPYVVMELVRGIPITEYCDRHRLSIRARLELFSRVCHAIQHAHQRRVIHGDIKPSRVLVQEGDGNPVPKVVGFGLAWAASPTLAEHTVFPRHGMPVDLPERMSPGQTGASCRDVDIGADVYALGVLLYELLVGVRPHEPGGLRDAALNELLSAIYEEPTVKPSARIDGLGAAANDLAANRSTKPRALARRLHGDLDSIAMRALKKMNKPWERRYASAWELARAVEGSLADEPPTANLPHAASWTRRFVRRHKVALVTVALLILLLGLASQRQKNAAKVIPWRQRLAAARTEQDRPEAAAKRLAAALERRRQVLGPENPDTPDSLERLAIVYFRQGRYSDARVLFDQSLSIERGLRGEDDPQTLQTKYNLALALEAEGNLEEAQALYLETLEGRRRVLGARTPLTVFPMLRLALIDAARGDAEGALGWLRQAIESGYGDSDWLRREPALASLHGPEFDALIEGAARNATLGGSQESTR